MVAARSDVEGEAEMRVFPKRKKEPQNDDSNPAVLWIVVVFVVAVVVSQIVGR